MRYISVLTKHSKKTGNDYKVLHIVFDNGYTFDTFISNEQEFCLLSTGEVVDPDNAE